MYTLSSVEIEGFWGRFNVSCTFNDDVNIIIGKNGTGKTTFMNILTAVLSVDVESLSSNDFSSVKIILKEGNKNKTIKVNFEEEQYRSFFLINYIISNKKYTIRSYGDGNRMPLSYRKKIKEDALKLKYELNKFTSLSSISVYRMRSSEDLELRGNNNIDYINPVDYKLNALLQELTRYQLYLSQKSMKVSNNLQKEVLASILYNKEDAEESTQKISFDKERERNELIIAFKQLKAFDDDVKKKIIFHIDAIDKTIIEIKKNTKKGNAVSSEKLIEKKIDIRSLEALRKTQRITKMSLNAEKEIADIFKPITLFLEILKQFMEEKSFKFDNGELVLYNTHGIIPHSSLSSGEKQLLILFIETLIQQNKTNIFLTDEPELSLHIAWQRQIIPAIKTLNPNAQIVAATHSPEVASKYRKYIFDMENLIND
ncbi:MULTISPECIES: AAA family ATPase [Proteus]|uniref:AAA family ATPase n=1 Tax=Proteus TaxID=583 RepID=UPI00124A9CD8|nr:MULTISPECIES: AAA family ATPase [Proteus]MBG2836109.1 AAA family ATPase [Proteus terrae subsp. cibarius]MBG2867247.1 AAA family ATPase [Proteus terrae subsp. cibarius]QEZ92299.1 ABC transporter ATP-binding protein [Proteus sp. CD3]